VCVCVCVCVLATITGVMCVCVRVCMAATITGVGVRFGTLDPDEPYTILGLEPGRPASLR
jgi:hypothetical protein